jgi:hypothetical protein
MAARKFAISIPEEVMRQVDRAAGERGVTRSRFIAEVLARAARARSDAEITRQLDRLFADPAVDREQRRTARGLQALASPVGTEW